MKLDTSFYVTLDAVLVLIVWFGVMYFVYRVFFPKIAEYFDRRELKRVNKKSRE
jgi:uncharacterized protein HemY